LALEREALIALRRRVEALRASPCDMAHESIPAGPDGDPMRSSRSPSGFARIGICPEALRAANLACSHTMARYVLREAIMQVPGDGDEAVVAALHELEQAISLLDHRRYDAESRWASAKLAKADGASAERDIAALVAEHRAAVTRAGELRDDLLRRIDEALGATTLAQGCCTGIGGLGAAGDCEGGSGPSVETPEADDGAPPRTTTDPMVRGAPGALGLCAGSNASE
jgi:hypothetical protein